MKYNPKVISRTVGSVFIALAIIIATYALIQSGRNHLIKHTSTSIPVVAAENFWGNIAGQIGGNQVSVSSLISNPNADPHLYESSAADAAAVSQARLVIINGLGYDSFMSQLLNSSDKPDRQTINISYVFGITTADANPHLWYDTSKLPEATTAIAQALSRIEPSHTKYFEANAQRFNASLQPLEQAIAAIRSEFDGDPVAYTERVPGYLISAAGLRNLTPAGFASSIEDGNDPSPNDQQAMEQLITEHKIKVLLYNSQTTSPVTDQMRALATANTIPIVGVSETLLPQYKSFQQWQLSQIDALDAALHKG